MPKSSNSLASAPRSYDAESTPCSNPVVGIKRRLPSGTGHAVSYDEQQFSVESPWPGRDDSYDATHDQPAPTTAQRTITVKNLHERTTYKDLANIVCGGRILNMLLRDDKSATLSFVEGAADFMAYVKRTDIYLHTKRVSAVLMTFLTDSSQCAARISLVQSAVPSTATRSKQDCGWCYPKSRCSGHRKQADRRRHPRSSRSHPQVSRGRHQLQERKCLYFDQLNS